MTLGDPKITAAERLRSEGGSNLKPRLSSRVSLSLEIASEVGLEKTKEIRSHCQSCFDEPSSEIVSLAEKCLESSTFPISEDYGQLV